MLQHQTITYTVVNDRLYSMHIVCFVH